MKKSLIVVLVLCLWGCAGQEGKDTNQEPVITEVIDIPAFKASPLQSALDIKPDTTVIPADKESFIGDGDLRLMIPMYAFIDAEGNYPEKVKLTHYVADDISNMLASNLTTLDQDGNVLSSNGMFYLNATTEDGKQLAISNESGVSVQVKTKSLSVSHKVYGGTEKDGVISWEEETTPNESILSFKASVLYPDPYWLNVPKAYRTTMNDPKFDYTNLTTIAVKERLYWSEDLSNHLNWLKEDYKDYMLNDPPATVMDIYIENKDQPIWVSDSLVYVHVQNKLDSCKATRDYCPYEKDIRFFIDLYKSFARQRLGKPFDFEPYMESLTSSDPEKALMDQGLSKARSNFIYSLYHRREEVSAEIDQDNKRRHKRNSYQLNRLGWSNIDRLYKLGDRVYPKVIVNIQNYDPSTTYRSYLLVPRYRVLVNLYVKDGAVRFNENEQKYGLSMFDDCFIVVLGINGEEYSLGQTKFKTIKDQEIDLELEGTTIEEFEALLQELNE